MCNKELQEHTVRELIKTALTLLRNSPNKTREQSLTITNLEQALLWHREDNERNANLYGYSE